MRYATRVLFGFGLAVLMLPCGASESSPLQVTDAWIRSAPPGAQVMGGFATLANPGPAPVVVTAARSDAFAMVEMHETTSEDGVSRMRAVPRLEIGPGATARLEPGGLHLMLMQPRHEVAVGARVEVAFVLDDGTLLKVPFEVRPADAMEAGSGDHHDHAGHGHD